MVFLVMRSNCGISSRCAAVNAPEVITRLATVRHADRIIVMDRGRIHAVGTHEELLRADGLYAHLASLQFLAA